QIKRVRQPRQVELHDWCAVVEGLAEVAVREARHEDPVLHPKRLVETELMADGVHVSLASTGLDEQCRRIAGDSDKKENRHRQQKQRQQAVTDPLPDILFHDALGFPPSSRLILAGFQRDVFKGRSVCKTGYQVERRLADPRADAVEEAQLPDRRIDRLLMDE